LSHKERWFLAFGCISRIERCLSLKHQTLSIENLMLMGDSLAGPCFLKRSPKFDYRLGPHERLNAGSNKVLV
jgi:hypothetical protein